MTGMTSFVGNKNAGKCRVFVDSTVSRGFEVTALLQAGQCIRPLVETEIVASYCLRQVKINVPVSPTLRSHIHH